MRAYLVRNPDRKLDRNVILRSSLDRKSFTLITLRSILDRFLVRKWDDVIDGGLPAGPEIKGDPAGLTQFFPCPLD